MTMIDEALKELGDVGCTPENFAHENAPWVDATCELYDKLGTLQGWSFRQLGDLPVVDLVFEHGVVSAHLSTLEVFAERVIHRVDGS